MFGLIGSYADDQDRTDAERIARTIAKVMHGPDAARHWRLYECAAEAILRDYHICPGGQRMGGGSLFG